MCSMSSKSASFDCQIQLKLRMGIDMMVRRKPINFRIHYLSLFELNTHRANERTYLDVLFFKNVFLVSHAAATASYVSMAAVSNANRTH